MIHSVNSNQFIYNESIAAKPLRMKRLQEQLVCSQRLVGDQDRNKLHVGPGDVIDEIGLHYVKISARKIGLESGDLTESDFPSSMRSEASSSQVNIGEPRQQPRNMYKLPIHELHADFDPRLDYRQSHPKPE